MAIFPLHNPYVTNYDVLRYSYFKGGMVLIRDSNGYAVKADRYLLSSDTLPEQIGKFMGFASNDHDEMNNIILADPVGSNYIDINANFITNVNAHYGTYKRSITEFSDENVSRYYNIFDRSLLTRRGVGVYNLESETYITDQFARVTAFTLYADDTTVVDLNPGDLLTFGAGINAGKLVKVDTSGYGPTVLVVGTVDRYDPGTNLLYFTHTFDYYRNITSLFTTGITLNLDANNPTSNPGSGTVWYDLSGNSLNATLLNGAAFTGNFVDLDGSNDFISISSNTLFDFPGDFTVETLYNAKSQTLHSLMGRRNMGGSGAGAWSLISFFRNDISWSSAGSGAFGGIGFGFATPTEFNRWFLFTATRSGSTLSLYLNAVLIGSFTTAYNHSSIFDLTIGKWDNGTYNPARVAAARLYQNVALTQDQIRQNFHAQIGNLI
jgi:hypothetical protein